MNCEEKYECRPSVIWWGFKEKEKEKEKDNQHDKQKDDYNERKRCRNLRCIFKCTCS